MKNLIKKGNTKLFFLVILVTLVSCGNQKKALDSVIENQETTFVEIPATCREISNHQITQTEFQSGLVVSVKTQGKVMIAPPAQVNAESQVEEGGLVRIFKIDGENAIEFENNSHFLITETSVYEGTCPDIITAQIASEKGTVFTLKFVLNNGYYEPAVDYENGEYITQNGMYRTKDQITDSVLWIKNPSFRLGVLYISEKRSDSRKVEFTKGYQKPKVRN